MYKKQASCSVTQSEFQAHHRWRFLRKPIFRLRESDYRRLCPRAVQLCALGHRVNDLELLACPDLCFPDSGQHTHSYGYSQLVVKDLERQSHFRFARSRCLMQAQQQFGDANEAISDA